MSGIKNPIQDESNTNISSSSESTDLKKMMTSAQIDVEDAKQNENGKSKETDAVFEVAAVESSDGAVLQESLVEDAKNENGKLKETDAVFEVAALESSDGAVLQESLVEDAKQNKNGKLKETDAIVEVTAVESSDDAVLQESLVEDVKRKEENGELKETEPILEVGPAKKSDNTVLRKLLRGPRYFDPQESESDFGKCYNCGGAGHSVTNCTASKRAKPCYVCGSLEHHGKQCKQGKGCFICKKGGHRAKNCPDKSKEGSEQANFCLKCGDPGHGMFTCMNVYSPDDLKEVQCYICKCFGHLCCVNYGESPSEVSCYRCGLLGHSGLECARVTVSAHAETPDTVSPNIPNTCCKCGEDGHKSRNCPNIVKKRKRRTRVSRIKEQLLKERLLKESLSKESLSKESLLKDNKDHVVIKSAPPDVDEAHKKKETQSGDSPSSQPRRRGGWIDENLGDFFKGTPSPSDGINYRSKNSFHENYGAKDCDSGFHFEPSGSDEYQHRFSASRFGNSSNNEKKECS